MSVVRERKSKYAPLLLVAFFLALVVNVVPARSSTKLQNHVNALRMNQRCLPPLKGLSLEGWRAAHVNVHAAKSRCNRPIAVIRAVFPAYAEGAAVRVASCESVRFTDFYNEGSGAAGMFQLMPLHYAGRFNPFNHLTNARYALRLYKEKGWWPWLASNGCHGLL